MVKRWLVGTAIAAALALGTPGATFAQQADAKQDTKQAGQDTKQAGKDAGAAAKDAGKATSRAAKRTAHRVKNDTKHAVRMTSATCKDGSVRRGRTKTTACAGHGGVGGR